jgi:hypothetical protein
MAGSNTQSLVTGLLVLLVVVALVYLVDPTFFGLVNLNQGFANMMSNGTARPGQMKNAGKVDMRNTMGNPNAAPRGKEGFANKMPMMPKGMPSMLMPKKRTEGFDNMDNMEGPADFGSAQPPAGCYPRDQLNPSDLLPADNNSTWAEQNPMGPGSLKGKNFLSAGALLGVNTVGQSLRNANWQLRSEPPNPQVPVSIFNQSTIQPDVNRRPLEIN